MWVGGFMYGGVLMSRGLTTARDSLTSRRREDKRMRRQVVANRISISKRHAPPSPALAPTKEARKWSLDSPDKTRVNLTSLHRLVR